MYTTAGGAMAQEESTPQQELNQKRQYCASILAWIDAIGLVAAKF
jgi:hypothetical protein